MILPDITLNPYTLRHQYLGSAHHSHDCHPDRRADQSCDPPGEPPEAFSEWYKSLDRVFDIHDISDTGCFSCPSVLYRSSRSIESGGEILEESRHTNFIEFDKGRNG